MYYICIIIEYIYLPPTVNNPLELIHLGKKCEIMCVNALMRWDFLIIIEFILNRQQLSPK